MPYAYGATITHEFDTDHLNIWLTFRHPMDQDLKPPLALWLLEADDVSYDIVASAWQDEFTLLLTSDTIVLYPERVLLEYNGPNSNLQTTWGKDWEPWGPKLSTNIGITPCFVDRGDPTSYDFVVGNFSKDGSWHDLDLSGIVPVGAKGVLLFVQIVAATVSYSLAFRKNGNSRIYNRNEITQQVANITITSDLTISLDPNRVIEYKATAGSWAVINVTVKTWWF